MTGGSNYVFYSYGNPPVWDDGLRPIIGTYHLDPLTVKNQLVSMYGNGQRKISLMLWHYSIPSWRGDRVAHCCSSLGGVLSAQHTQNLVDVLLLLHDIGFEHLNFRFAPQSGNWPLSWTEWNEPMYQENRQFIWNTRSIIETHAQLPRTYDLGVELGGELGNAGFECTKYGIRLWKAYTGYYGATDSCSFSFKRPWRIHNFINDCALARIPYPAAYAVDMYGNNDPYFLMALTGTLKSLKEQNKPVIIQECFYNNDIQAVTFKAAKDAGLNIRDIYQYPVTVPGQHLADRPVYTPLFDKYAQG